LSTTKGCFLSHAINAFSFKLHIPGYQFCGPGTHLEKRLTKGNRDINPLNSARHEHYIAYSRNKDLAKQQIVDKILIEKIQKHITTFRLSERELLPLLFGYENQDKNRYEFENKEE